MTVPECPRLVSQLRTSGASAAAAALGWDPMQAVLCAVFVGATEGTTSIIRVLKALVQTLEAKTALLPDHEVDNAADGGGGPVDLPGLQQALGKALAELSEAGRRVLLVFDAVNELGDAHGGRALRWLPARLPVGCTVCFAS